MTDNPFAGIPATILELGLPKDTVWVKCEKCTDKMVEATKKHKKGFFAQLKHAHVKFHRKEDFFENKYFIPSVFTFKDGKKAYGMLHCSNTNVGRPMWNEHGFTGVTDNTVIVMDRNYHFGHLHRVDIPSFAKYTLEDELELLEQLNKYGGAI